jgi:hypothetical protein
MGYAFILLGVVWGVEVGWEGKVGGWVWGKRRSGHCYDSQTNEAWMVGLFLDSGSVQLQVPGQKTDH